MSDPEPKVVFDTDEHINEVLKDSSKMVVIAMLMRPGVRSLMIATEWRLFCPYDEGLNEKFQLILKKWQDLPCVVMVVPLSYKEQVEEIATELSLKLVQGRTLIVIGGEKGVDSFPIHCDEDRMFTVENVAGSAVYANDPGLFQKETDGLDKFETEEKQKAAARYQ